MPMKISYIKRPLNTLFNLNHGSFSELATRSPLIPGYNVFLPERFSNGHPYISANKSTNNQISADGVVQAGFI